MARELDPEVRTLIRAMLAGAPSPPPFGTRVEPGDLFYDTGAALRGKQAKLEDLALRLQEFYRDPAGHDKRALDSMMREDILNALKTGNPSRMADYIVAAGGPGGEQALARRMFRAEEARVNTVERAESGSLPFIRDPRKSARTQFYQESTVSPWLAQYYAELDLRTKGHNLDPSEVKELRRVVFNAKQETSRIHDFLRRISKALKRSPYLPIVLASLGAVLVGNAFMPSAARDGVEA